MQKLPVITTDGLTRRFGDVVAVDHLSLEVQPGEIFGFLGHNGAGKTTTVRLLNGVLTADEGTARVLDLDPAAEGPILRRSTGILTETPSLDERLTGRENLLIYADLYGLPPLEIPQQVNGLLDLFELAHRSDDRVSGYSKGMKQRLALARALLHSPRLLFLDEPTAGLDPVAARRVHSMITRLSEEEQRTVFLCTHNLEEAQRLCDRVAVLEHGRLVALGTPTELARQLGRSQRLEIQVSPDCVQAAVGVLQATFSTTTIAQEDDLFTVVGADREVVPGLVASLVSAGVRIYSVTPQEPSLEDIYFALHGETTLGGIGG
jgi:ABC-2 type transport system ATP-binding protein